MEKCPEAEVLAAYSAGEPGSGSFRWVDDHLRSCASCLNEVRRAHRRIHAPSPAAPLPAALAARVRPVVVDGPRWDAEHEAAGPSGFERAREWMRRWGEWLRPNVLVPAVAALLVALVAVPVLQGPSGPAGPDVTYRGADFEPYPGRVSVSHAELFGAPSPHAELVRTLDRGTRLQVIAEDREWRRVRLADGTEGWMDRLDLGG